MIFIEDFITTLRESHSIQATIFTSGSCWNFFKLMKVVWPDAVPWYNGDHIAVWLCDDLWDITGRIKDKQNYLPFYDCHPPSVILRIISEWESTEYQIPNYAI